MMKTTTVVLTAVLVAGLTAACGQSAATADDRAEAAEPQAIEESANETADAALIPASAEATPETATPVPTQEKATSETTTSLPLRHGYYVRSDTPCNRASRGDIVALVSNTGTNLNCTFKKIEKTGATTYRVTSECSDGGVKRPGFSGGSYL